MTAGLFAKHAFSRLEDAAAELRYAAMVERTSASREWAEGDESDCPLGATNSEFVARLRANARRRLADFDDYIAYANAVIEGRPCGCCKKMEVSMHRFVLALVCAAMVFLAFRLPSRATGGSSAGCGLSPRTTNSVRTRCGCRHEKAVRWGNHYKRPRGI